ncbi:MAG: DUF2207 domain-containing protein [Candidatus ainarchaeum sp.]|nr:DUF2207 domain-containing protein [Candidatus ainarchaeum sp.]
MKKICFIILLLILLTNNIFSETILNLEDNDLPSNITIKITPNFQNETQTILIIFALQIILFFICWNIFGKKLKFKKNTNCETNQNEIPFEYSPTIVKLLMVSYLQKIPTINEISTEILYLCQKGYLQIQQEIINEKEEFIIHIKNTDPRNLFPSQIAILDLLKKIAIINPTNFWDKKILRKYKAKKNKILLITDLKYFILQNKDFKKNWIKDWQKKIQNEYNEQKFDNLKTGFTPFILSNLIIALIISIIKNNYFFLLYSIFTTTLITILFGSKLVKKTEKGENHHNKWNNFKTFLKDYSRAKEIPIHAISQWEKNIIYSIPLNEKDSVKQTMNTIFKNQKFHSSFITSNQTSDFEINELSQLIHDFSNEIKNVFEKQKSVKLKKAKLKKQRKQSKNKENSILNKTL